jgi:hypothetical protein
LPRKLKSELGLFMLPNPKRAQELVEYARQLFCERSDAGGAIRLLEQAILFDQITALDSGWHAQRADLYEQLGILAPRTALRLYAMGIKFKHLDADDYAEQAYSRASLIDEPFLWSANNFSWMVATGLSSGGAEKRKGEPWRNGSASGRAGGAGASLTRSLPAMRASVTLPGRLPGRKYPSTLRQMARSPTLRGIFCFSGMGYPSSQLAKWLPVVKRLANTSLILMSICSGPVLFGS